MEVGLVGGEWTIPVCRMKSRREHRVPLSPWTLEKATGDRSPCSLAIFWSRSEPAPFSGLALLRKATVPSVGLPLRAAATRGERRSRLGESAHPEPQGGRINMRKPLLAYLAGLPSQVQVQEVPSNPATGLRRCKTQPVPAVWKARTGRAGRVAARST